MPNTKEKHIIKLPAMLLTIADFGKIKNLKTEESEAILNALIKIDPKTQLLYRHSKHFNYKHSSRIVPGGSFFLRVVDRICRIIRIRPRPVVKAVMDSFAVGKLKHPCILVTVPKGFPKTLKKNRELGGINICYEAFAASNYRWRKRTFANNTDPMLNLYHHFLLLSTITIDTYLQQGISSDRLHLVHMGVDIKKFSPAARSDSKFRVLCIGAEPVRKGFQIAIEAWNELDLENAELCVVGNGVQSHLEKFAGSGVILKGFSDARKEMNSSNILLHPAGFEPFGKIVTEAMASGLPVIVSDQTGAKDLVIDGFNGTVIPANDIEAIKRSILWHYKNRKESIVIGANARSHIASSYTWKDFSNRVSGALNKIVNSEKN